MACSLAGLAAAIYITAAAAAPVTQDLLIRLHTPLTTMNKAGARFDAIVTGCVHADCTPLLPPGSTIQGHVKQVHAVGFGLRREKASMALAFDGCLLPDGGVVQCRLELLTIDNAREAVSAGNRIHGILAANHPHSLLGGLWVRPTSALLPRSASGITGAGRMIYTGISPHPLVGGAIIATRLAVLRLPEPEIYIPAGTEMLVRATGDLHEHPEPRDQAALPDDLSARLMAAPVQVSQPDGSLAADIVNIAIRGSKHDVAQAFLGAGWMPTDPLNTRTFARSYRAFTSLEAYPTAPVSPLRYQGRLPDLVFQKSFNSMAKRHHIRLWQVDSPDGPVWLGAATHDIGISFDWKRLALSHRIDREIDRERDKVVADLHFGGCASHVTRLERPALSAHSTRRTTDGALYVFDAHMCQQIAAVGGDAPPRRKVNIGKAMIRRTILESRHYLLRGNGYYWAFRGLSSRQMLGRFAAPKTEAAVSEPAIVKNCWRCGSGSNRRMRVLQTLALPLGYRTTR